MRSKEERETEIARVAIGRLQQWQSREPGPPLAGEASLSARQVAAMIDHTQLKPDAGADKIRQLCAEAREYDFASVCVNSAWVPLCRDLLDGCAVKVCSVTGFALGANLTAVKRYEAEQAIQAGAARLTW